jgi:NADH-quinone oxidoreductase subunit N
MFFTDSVNEEVSVVVPSVLTKVALTISVAVTIFLGVLPQPVLDLLNKAIFLR